MKGLIRMLVGVAALFLIVALGPEQSVDALGIHGAHGHTRVLGPAAEQFADHRRPQEPRATGDQHPAAAPGVRRVIHPVAPPRAAVLRSGQGPYPRPSSRVKRKRRRHAALRSSRFSHR